VLNIGAPEMMVVALVLIIVVGPKDLPRVIRTMAKWMAKARSMAREFQVSIDDMARAADLDDVRREISSIGSPDVSKGLDGVMDPTVSGMDYPVEKQDAAAEEFVAPAAPPSERSAEPEGAIGPAPVVADAAAESPGPETPEPAAVADDPPTKRAAGA
jgi:sec-independent protein translocase protein TatB